MQPLYPLRFKPVFKRHLWGGRRLESELGKAIGPEEDYAESWEIVDHGDDQSIVAHGPLAGTALAEIVASRGPELFGHHAPQDNFPLLLKFLDANRDLSVQVHPNDNQAAELNPPDLGKTEAWVVLDALPGSVVYAGLKRGFDRAALEREISRGTSHLCLHRYEPRAGDCIFIPAGTVHALGAGLLIAEIQQASDTTFRLYDWNRVAPDGRPRDLHIQRALDVIDFERGPVDPQQPQTAEAPGIHRLVQSDKFVLDRRSIKSADSVGGDGRFHILAVIDGELRIEGDPTAAPLRRGDTMLVPACVGATAMTPHPNAEVLDAYLP